MIYDLGCQSLKSSKPQLYFTEISLQDDSQHCGHPSTVVHRNPRQEPHLPGPQRKKRKTSTYIRGQKVNQIGECMVKRIQNLEDSKKGVLFEEQSQGRQVSYLWEITKSLQVGKFGGSSGIWSTASLIRVAKPSIRCASMCCQWIRLLIIKCLHSVASIHLDYLPWNGPMPIQMVQR